MPYIHQITPGSSVERKNDSDQSETAGDWRTAHLKRSVRVRSCSPSRPPLLKPNTHRRSESLIPRATSASTPLMISSAMTSTPFGPAAAESYEALFTALAHMCGARWLGLKTT